MLDLRKIANVTDTIKLLEDDMQGEQGAIEMYNRHIQQIDDKDIKDLLAHIVNEEKEHLKELKELIEKKKGGN